MKRIIAAIIVAFSVFSVQQASCQDLKSILGGLSKQAGKGSSGSDKLGGVLNTVTSLVAGKADYSSVVGNWSYVGPAVSFQSDNFLQKAGGAAAATMLENKVKPYYERAGLTNLRMEFKQDSTFTATAGKFKAQGSVVSNGDGSFTFQFKAFGSLPSGKVKGYIEKSGSNIMLTFDASKLIGLVSKIASVSGNATLKSASSLLNTYDGLNIGFKLKKTSGK